MLEAKAFLLSPAELEVLTSLKHIKGRSAAIGQRTFLFVYIKSPALPVKVKAFSSGIGKAGR